jgi:hypothetical protein
VSISPEKIAAHKLAADRLWIIKKLGEQIEQLGAENKELKAQVFLQMKWKTEAQDENDRLCEVNATLLKALDDIETSTYEPATAARARAAIDAAMDAPATPSAAAVDASTAPAMPCAYPHCCDKAGNRCPRMFAGQCSGPRAADPQQVGR